MTGFETVGLYAGLFLLLFAGLKMNCGRVRLAERVNFGEGGNEAMRQAMRVQGNAVEDVPITLIGLLALAALSAPVLLIQILGGVAFVARLAHAFSLGRGDGRGIGRFVGTAGSGLTLIATGISCLWIVLS